MPADLLYDKQTVRDKKPRNQRSYGIRGQRVRKETA